MGLFLSFYSFYFLQVRVFTAPGPGSCRSGRTRGSWQPVHQSGRGTAVKVPLAGKRQKSFWGGGRTLVCVCVFRSVNYVCTLTPTNRSTPITTPANNNSTNVIFDGDSPHVFLPHPLSPPPRPPRPPHHHPHPPLPPRSLCCSAFSVQLGNGVNSKRKMETRRLELLGYVGMGCHALFPLG